MKILNIKKRDKFYSYLKDNHNKIKECFIFVKKGNPNNIKGILSYIDAVECALCFGWIDSQTKSINGKLLQRFSPRVSKKDATILNIARINRLIKRGEMTKDGLKVITNLNKEYKYPSRIINRLKKDKEAYKFFKSTPKLYQDIRISNIESLYKKNKPAYKLALSSLIYKCHNHKIYGEWSDYGRLS